ncbi:MAG: hypothetical protein RSB96_03050 [Oscillospiraceae bacterium]
MITILNVLKEFLVFANLPNNESYLYHSLCQTAIDEVLSKLNYDLVMPKDNLRITMAAAACAYYAYSFFGQNNTESIKLGELSVSSSTEQIKDRSLKLKNHYLQGITDITKGSGVVFICT